MATASSIHGYGLLSARPAAATATAGNYYTAYDTGYTYRDNGLTWDVVAGTGTGTVTSVAMTVPTGFSVAGSPVTSSGTLAVTESTQSANTVKAGPTTGAAATPGYRALVTADMPAGTGTVTTVSGTAPISVATGSTTPAITHDTSGVSAGTSSGITVDAKGHVTARTALVAADLPTASNTAVGGLKDPFLFSQYSDVTVASTTAATSLLSGSITGTKTAPANALTQGRILNIECAGLVKFTNPGTVPSLLIKLKLGSTVIKTLQLSFLGCEPDTKRPFKIWFDVGCRSTGVSGTVKTTGLLAQGAVQDTIAGGNDQLSGGWDTDATNPVATINTTTTQAVDITATWSASSASNSITMENAAAWFVGN